MNALWKVGMHGINGIDKKESRYYQNFSDHKQLK